jgi:hypothetical protein
MRDHPDSSADSNRAVCFGAVLAEELSEIHQLRLKRGEDGSPPPAEIENMAVRRPCSGPCAEDPVLAAGESRKVFNAAHKMDLLGLSFSGGGIRSATFNLGILQGLADLNLLRQVDYLSTVSGGGYIGSWLEAWILRAGQEEAESDSAKGGTAEPKKPECKPRTGIEVVELELKSERVKREGQPAGTGAGKVHTHTEPPPIRFLREYSNYLTPRVGFFGADTWAMIAIILRNLLLNQTVLTLFLFSILLVPYMAAYVVQVLRHSGGGCLHQFAPVAVFLLLMWALFLGSSNLGSLMGDVAKRKEEGKWFPQRQGWIVGTIAAPILAAAWILTGWLWTNIPDWKTKNSWLAWCLGGVVGLGIPWIVSCLAAPKQTHSEGATWELRHRRLVWGISAILMGAAAGLLMSAVFYKAFVPMSRMGGAKWHELAIGVPLTMLVFWLGATIQLGLMGRTFFDPYREWWSRLGGWIFIVTIMWAAAFALAIYAPLGLLWLRGWLATAGLGWIAATATGVFGAKSSKTSGVESNTWKDVALSVTPYIFIVGLASLLSFVVELILARINLQHLKASTWHDFLAESPGVEKIVNWVVHLTGNTTTLTITDSCPRCAADATPAYVAAHWDILQTAANPWLLLWLAIAFGGCLFMAWRVDLNEFSMNLFYRNRLVRCYLGATRRDRDPNPFSGFDTHDDLFLNQIREKNCYSGPFPIFNSTLNLVSTRDLAWQERKAESFSMTPLRCGFDTWLERIDLSRDFSAARDKRAECELDEFAYRRTDGFAYKDGGFLVGTATSISGAALSPNMGYYSTPSLAMLMTFFNVRLGFWAGNPRNNSTWKLPGPQIGLGRLLGELFGLSDDNARYVYLSDGGHFENLGIYELVKRRTKYIIACDAGADPGYGFDDLGNAIRKCREDVGVEIDLVTDFLVPETRSKDCDSQKKRSEWHCAVGTIHYDSVDPEAEKGKLLYIKASLTGDEPADVLNYQTCHTQFPHETTTDQWFTESQFESYRRLGQHILEKVFTDSGADKVVSREPKPKPKEWFKTLEQHWGAEKARQMLGGSGKRGKKSGFRGMIETVLNKFVEKAPSS